MSDIETDEESGLSDSSDEEFDIFYLLWITANLKDFRFFSNIVFCFIIEETVSNTDDKTFFEHFRVSRQVLEDVVHKFEKDQYYNQGFGKYGKISARGQVIY